MKQLEKLEEKIIQVIQSNKNLMSENSELRKELEQLKAQGEQLQSSLMKESNNALSLAQEKDNIKNTIKDLLSSISSLESTK